MNVAVDVETTGLTPYYHEVIEIAILPLNEDLTINADVLPFHQRVKPERWDTISAKALEVNGESRESLENNPTRVASLQNFAVWHQEHVHEKLFPLAQNWTFDKSFIIAWMDPNRVLDNVLDKYFHYQFRDTLAVAHFLCDRARAKNRAIPFARTSLTNMCKLMGIPHEAHTAMGDATACANLYRKFVYG